MGNIVVKDNALIEASHKLSEVEQRLILLAILKARDTCKTIEHLQGKELIIYADDYASTFEINRQMSYKALKKAVLGLFEAKWGYKYINSKGDKVIRYERFIQSAQYIEGEGSVSFKFADAIVPMLVELEKRFTVYEIEQVSKLSSAYSMRLYEFFMQHLDKKTGKGWLEISLDELRFRFGLLPTEYKAMSDFKKYVLDLSVKQINQRTNLSATYTQKKQGRTIVGFRFEFTQKTKTVKVKSKDSKDIKTIDIFAGFADIERQMIQSRIEEHIKRLEQKGEIVDSFHRQNITKKAVTEKWGLDVLVEQQRQEQERKARLAVELAQKQAQEKEEREKIEQSKRRFNAMIAHFESLPLEEQERILDEIGQNPMIEVLGYNQQRANGVKVYKQRMFSDLFYQYFGI